MVGLHMMFRTLGGAHAKIQRGYWYEKLYLRILKILGTETGADVCFFICFLFNHRIIVSCTYRFAAVLANWQIIGTCGLLHFHFPPLDVSLLPLLLSDKAPGRVVE